MKPSVAAAKQAKAAEDLAAMQASIKEQLDRIEAKLDAMTNQKPAKAAPADKAEKTA